MNLHEKLIEIRKIVPYLQKNKKGHNYSYVNGTTVLGSLKAKMDELGVLLIPSVTEFETSDFLRKEKRMETVKCKMIYTWVDSSKPEDRIDIPFACFGSQDDISKAFGSALTYSERYFMLKFFNIPTDEVDPDKFQDKYGDEPKDETEEDEERKDKAEEAQLKKEGKKLQKGIIVPDGMSKKAEEIRNKVEFKKEYLGGKIKRIDKYNFTVEGSEKEPYQVDLAAEKGKGFCSCAARGICWHRRIAILIGLAESQNARDILDNLDHYWEKHDIIADTIERIK